MKKIQTSSLLLAIVFAAIGFFMSMALLNLNKYKLVEKISQNYIGKHAITFKFERLSSVERTSLIDTLKTGDILYKKIDPTTKEVLFKGSANSFPLIEGNFFEKTKANEKVGNLAIVGKEIRDKSGKDVTYVNSGVSYEIIGITGIEQPSKLDRMVFLQTNSSQLDCDGVWILDGDNSLTDTFQNIQRFSEQVGGGIKKLDVSQDGLGRFFQNESIFQIIYFIVFVSFITSIAALTVYWGEQRKSVIAIQKLCGFSKSLIFWISLKQYLLISTISYVVGCTVGILVLPQRAHFLTESFSYYASTIFLGILICLIPLIMMMKRATDRAVRGVH
ncbi:FtsX-like permease family protein [Paenibacillus chitinolyticus]|uniref:FtsX-like permease family protein n=1 Tax=Paenibacillus chitinolyticus TaxID=79263 RepID=UPI0036D8D9B7